MLSKGFYSIAHVTSKVVPSSLFILVSFVYKSLQYLTSTLTQGGKGGHLFRLTLFNCAARREEHFKQIPLACVGSAYSVWVTLGLPPLTACALSRSILLRLQVALQGNRLRWALACVHFLGLSHSGSGSQVLHKGTDSARHTFCALPRSEQLR